MLRVKNLLKRIDHSVLLDHVAFEVKDGEVVCLYGSNGSGKSTTMRIIAGLEKADGGEIIFKNKDLTEMKPWERVNAGVAYAFQIPRPFRSLKFIDNLALPLMKDYEKERAYEIAHRTARDFGVSHLIGKRAMHLSQGEMKILELLKAFLTGANLLLLDEPFASLDTENARFIREKLEEMKERGVSMLITSHKKRILEGIADRFMKLQNGVIHVES